MKNLNKAKIQTKKFTENVTIKELLWNEFLRTGKIGWYLFFITIRDLDKTTTVTYKKDKNIYGKNC